MFSATKFIVAGVIVALFGGFMLTGVLTTQQGEESLPAVGASASASLGVSPVVTDVIEVDVAEDWPWRPLAATGDAVWVAGGDDTEGVVSRIDATSREVTDAIIVGPGAERLLPTTDAVWVVHPLDGRVSRIDLDSRTVTDTIRVGDGGEHHWIGSPLIADGSLWLYTGLDPHGDGEVDDHTLDDRALVEIDLAERRVRNVYPLPSGHESVGWAEVIDGAIWTWSTHDLLARFDLDAREFTDAVDRRGSSNYGECCIAGDDAIWLTSSEHDTVRRFDLATHEVTDRLRPGGRVTRGIAAAGAIWIPDARGDVVRRIDLGSTEVTDKIPIGKGSFASGFGRYPAYAHGAIWVSASGLGGGTVSRIDPEAREVTHTFAVGGEPGTPLAFDGAIWVPSEGAVTRIATGSATEETTPGRAAVVQSLDAELASAPFKGTYEGIGGFEREVIETDEGLTQEEGGAETGRIEATDPRLSGDLVLTRNSVATADGTEVSTLVVEVSNDGGRWLGTSTGGFEFDWAYVLSGVDGYEGLTAYMTVSDIDGMVEGVIFPADMSSAYVAPVAD